MLEQCLSNFRLNPYFKRLKVIVPANYNYLCNSFVLGCKLKYKSSLRCKRILLFFLLFCFCKTIWRLRNCIILIYIKIVHCAFNSQQFFVLPVKAFHCKFCRKHSDLSVIVLQILNYSRQLITKWPGRLDFVFLTSQIALSGSVTNKHT